MTNMMTQSAYTLDAAERVATLSGVGSFWHDDLQKHATLTHEIEHIGALQIELMERQRRLLSQLQSHAGKVAANVPSDPSSKNSSTTVTVQSQIHQIDHDLIDLDNRVQKINCEMRELEGRILTHEPKNLEGVQQMMRFVSNVLAMDHKIDPEYLSEVLACCSSTMETKANDARH